MLSKFLGLKKCVCFWMLLQHKLGMCWWHLGSCTTVCIELLCWHYQCEYINTCRNPAIQSILKEKEGFINPFVICFFIFRTNEVFLYLEKTNEVKTKWKYCRFLYKMNTLESIINSWFKVVLWHDLVHLKNRLTLLKFVFSSMRHWISFKWNLPESMPYPPERRIPLDLNRHGLMANLQSKPHCAYSKICPSRSVHFKIKKHLTIILLNIEHK